MLLALHVYAGGSAQANTELIALVYQASFKGLTAWDMEIDLLDVSDPLEALQSMLRLRSLSTRRRHLSNERTVDAHEHGDKEHEDGIS